MKIDLKMPPAEVVVLPGVERRDLCGSPVASQAVLAVAIENGVIDVVVVGRARDGSRYIASAGVDADKTVGMLMGAATFLCEHRFTQGIPAEQESEEPNG